MDGLTRSSSLRAPCWAGRCALHRIKIAGVVFQKVGRACRGVSCEVDDSTVMSWGKMSDLSKAIEMAHACKFGSSRRLESL